MHQAATDLSEGASAFPGHLGQVGGLQNVPRLLSQKDLVLFLPYHLLAV